MRKKTLFLLCTATVFFLLSSCSINKLVVRAATNALTAAGDSTVFTGDDDPELVGDAFPVMLKVYEIMLEQNPEDPPLLMTTGSMFVMYANAFVQTPAEMLPEYEFNKQFEMYRRAKKLYLRGRDYIIKALDIKYPGFKTALENDTDEEYLSAMTAEDVPYLYWTAAGWMGAFSTDTFDFALSVTLPKAVRLMHTAYSLNPDWGGGSIDDFYISFYGSMPAELGGSQEKAREHFERAVETSGGKNPSPYVSLATTVSVANQNADEYRQLLEKAAAIDVDQDPANRLANTITQRKAKWRLDHIEDYFLLD